MADEDDNVAADVRSAAKANKESRPELAPALARVTVREMIELGHQIEYIGAGIAPGRILDVQTPFGKRFADLTLKELSELKDAWRKFDQDQNWVLAAEGRKKLWDECHEERGTKRQ